MSLILPKETALQQDLRRRLDAIKANQDKLDNCLQHHFPEWNVGLTIGVKFKCSKCQGMLDAVNAYNYTKGYIAAGKPAEDIMPGWYAPFEGEQAANSVVTGNGFKKEGTNDE